MGQRGVGIVINLKPGLETRVDAYRKLILEVSATSLSGVEVRLNGHADAAANDAVTVAAAQRGLHARHA